jgi:hypothetical protein
LKYKTKSIKILQVNPITHFDQLCKLEKRGDEIKKKNLLLRNQWANCNQTLVEWSLDSSLPKKCPVIPTFNQDGRQARNRKKWRNDYFIKI